MKLYRLLDFEPIKTFVLKPRSASIDNIVFRLHYRVTVLILLAFCLMVTAKQFFGDPIDCVVKQPDDDEHHFEKVINRYCWIHTTFSVNAAWRKQVGAEVPYPGVDKRHPTDEVTYHAYYQWVCFVLLLQALVFYLPHVVWKRCEGNLTKRLLNGLDGAIMEREDRLSRISMVSDYLAQTNSHHNLKFFAYVFTEYLNLANIITQMVLVNKFLNGKFFNYGNEILSWKHWVQFPLQYDPMMEVFPRMTKCTFHMFGPSGDLMKYDTMCVLPINIVNEKGYTFLWFWFYFLAAVSIINVAYRVVTMCCPCLRVTILKSHFKGHRRDVASVLRHSGLGDWFLLCLLAKNMNKKNFRELLVDLKVKFQAKEKIM